MKKGYLSDSEKIMIYAIQHPDTPVGSTAQQRQALFNSYGESRSSRKYKHTDPWDTKKRLVKGLLIIGLIILLTLLAILPPHLLYIALLI